MTRALHLAIGILAVAVAVTAAPMVDLTVAGPYNFGQVTGTGQWSQSFTAESDNAAGAGVWIFSPVDLAGATGTFELRLYSELPALGGSPLATGSANVTLSGTPEFYDVFWTPVPTTVGNTYYLQILHSLPTGAAPNFAGNTYAGGSAFSNSAAFVNFDAPIRIFNEPGTPNGVIPEPSAFVLMGGGVAAILAMRLRTRLAAR